MTVGEGYRPSVVQVEHVSKIVASRLFSDGCNNVNADGLTLTQAADVTERIFRIHHGLRVGKHSNVGEAPGSSGPANARQVFFMLKAGILRRHPHIDPTR